jgi:hypothetical protein
MNCDEVARGSARTVPARQHRTGRNPLHAVAAAAARAHPPRARLHAAASIGSDERRKQQAAWVDNRPSMTKLPLEPFTRTNADDDQAG